VEALYTAQPTPHLHRLMPDKVHDLSQQPLATRCAYKPQGSSPHGLRMIGQCTTPRGCGEELRQLQILPSTPV
jgi:hypothetical protein